MTRTGGSGRLGAGGATYAYVGNICFSVKLTRLASRNESEWRAKKTPSNYASLLRPHRTIVLGVGNMKMRYNIR